MTVAPSPARPRPDAPPEQPGFAVDGARLTLLDPGPRRLDAILALIEVARRSLRFLYDIYADDETGRRVNAALTEAARRGVRVRVLLVDYGIDRDANRSGVALMRLAARRRGIEDRLRGRITRAVQDGELPADADAEALAAHVMAVIQGLSTLARDGAPRDKLLRVTENAMSAWLAAAVPLPRA